MRFSRVLLLLTTATATVICSQAKQYKAGKWCVGINGRDGGLTAVYDGDTIVSNSDAMWGLDGDVIRMSDSRDIKISEHRVQDDVLGKVTLVTVTGTVPRHGVATLELAIDSDSPVMTACLRVAGVDAARGINYMAPVNNGAAVTISGTDNRQLFVPYDNDAWVRYSVREFGEESPESYEVGALFDAVTRRGVVIGSIDHDMWKSAVRYVTSSGNRVDTLTAYCGASSSLTRDVRPHGKVKGAVVSSPRFIIISATDWRDGMERFADACAAVAPNHTKGGPRPFGWNSWGDLQTKINFENASQVTDFIADELAGSFHAADSSIVVNLDAFWDFGFTPGQHSEFVKACRDKGIKPGIYYCPFTDWSKNPDATVNEAPAYKMGDLYLRHGGVPVEFDGAPALDPTHPGTRARIERQLQKFMDWGYEYVKIDFMAHGAYESDSHFDPEVMTGTQAFSRGMQYIDSIVDNRMWINLSIAPLFPACYAQSRRIGCDAWSDMGSTEYTLNALTYGWWLDHMYHYNDADHIVFKGVSEGENRARLTSSAITGVYFLGDNFSAGGDSTTFARAKVMACNDEINSMARRTKSFRPVRPGRGERASDIFEGRDGNTVWVALFNYDNDCRVATVDLTGELGIDPDGIAGATELWTSSPVELSGNCIDVDIPSKDVRIIKLELK